MGNSGPIAKAARAWSSQTREIGFCALIAAGAAAHLVWRRDSGPPELVHEAAEHRAAVLVVLVHGFGSSPRRWSALVEALRGHDVAVATFGYASTEGTVEQLGRDLADAVAVLIERGQPGVVRLVGHSLGGLVIAEALSRGLLDHPVDLVVTLGSPLCGSPLAGRLPVPGLLRCLRLGSPELRRLVEVLVPAGVRWLSISSTGDLLVRSGQTVVPSLTEALVVEGIGHCELLVHREVLDRIVAAVTEPAIVRAGAA